MTQPSSEIAAKRLTLQSRTREIRDRFALGGLTGIERIQLTDVLVEIETEIEALNPTVGEIDPRADIIAKAEEYEEKANNDSLSNSERQAARETALAIRNAVITSDTRAHELEEEHKQALERGEASREKLEQDFRTQVAEQEAEIEAELELDRRKQS